MAWAVDKIHQVIKAKQGAADLDSIFDADNAYEDEPPAP